MPDIAKFIEARVRIETLAKQATVAADRKALNETKQGVDEANRLLEILKTMVANDVQVSVIDRLTRQLNGLGTKVDAMAAKKPVRKKQPTA